MAGNAVGKAGMWPFFCNIIKGTQTPEKLSTGGDPDSPCKYNNVITTLFFLLLKCILDIKSYKENGTRIPAGHITHVFLPPWVI